MNNGIFRLVFSTVLNMYIPASEAANPKTCKSSGRKARGLAKKILIASLTSTTASVAWAGGPAALKDFFETVRA